MQSPELILNITCPSYVTVAAPGGYPATVTRYVGALGIYAQYDFPAFYPTFEQCNFITGYQLTQEDDDGYNALYGRNNSMSSYGLVNPIDGLTIVEAAHHNCAREPCVPQTIELNTDRRRTYPPYHLLIETQLTNTAWSEFLYHYSRDSYTIEVVYGDWSAASVVQAPSSLFDCDETIAGASGDIECIKTYYLDDGTGGEIEYIFDHFQCDPRGALSHPQYGCEYYNISPRNTEIAPFVAGYGNGAGSAYVDYTLDPPVKFLDPTTGTTRLKVTVPTDVLRNGTAGN